MLDLRRDALQQLGQQIPKSLMTYEERIKTQVHVVAYTLRVLMLRAAHAEASPNM